MDNVPQCTKGWDERCSGAISRVCKCSCGGANHGVALAGRSDSVSLPLMRDRSIFDWDPAEPRVVDVLFPGPTITLERDLVGKITTNVPRIYVVHSPMGFEWGYGGSGPADLALNILAMFVSPVWAWKLHHFFKFKFLAGMPKEVGIIKGEDIYGWILKEMEVEG